MDYLTFSYYQSSTVKDTSEEDNENIIKGIIPNPLLKKNEWGCTDILSSHGEMRKRYGFICVNRDETDLRYLKRYKKKSFEWFKNVIEDNGENV